MALQLRMSFLGDEVWQMKAASEPVSGNLIRVKRFHNQSWTSCREPEKLGAYA